jgi:hypothetical protein
MRVYRITKKIKNETQRLPNNFSAVVICTLHNMVAMAKGRAGAEQHEDKAQEGKQGEAGRPPILPHVRRRQHARQ